MILLSAFAFLAGIVTVLSPCILPILPIVLSSTLGGKQIGKARPFGVITGFIASFTFFTLFLSTIVSVSGIPSDALRLFSVLVIGVFGISLLIPAFQKLLERLFSQLANVIPQGRGGTSFWSGFIIGISLGLLWTPCVGPILASVIALAITGEVTLATVAITVSYALGTAIPLLGIMLGGQKLLQKVPWLLSHTTSIQKAFGVVMILVAFAIFNNYDRLFQTYVLQTFPSYGVGLTTFENNTQVRDQLEKLTGKKETGVGSAGQPMFAVQPKGIKAPEIIPGGVWLNSEPLTLDALKGKVVLIDFWTYSCINCQRTLPYLRKWYETYKDKGLIIIGVHSPEFAFEKEEKNVAKAIADFGLHYPVVQDNDFATWQAYSNQYWPAKYLIDKEGYIRYTHFGEGNYNETEKAIQELLKETGRTDVSMPIQNKTYTNYAQTPESYLGYGRIARFASSESIAQDSLAKYTAPKVLADNQLAYKGPWVVMEEYANPQKGAELLLNFEAKEVFLVMRAKKDSAKVKVYIDNKNSTVTVDADKLYKLINLPNPGRHILRLEFEDNNAELYAFTFG